MALNKDFEDLLHLFNAARVKYLVVGAYAVIYYTEPRYTKDLDIWIQPTPQNAEKVYDALRRFGAPVKDLTLNDLTNPTMVYQLGVAPNRIDILMGIGAISFDHAWKNRQVSSYGRERIHLLSQGDLIRAKKAANRPQDRVDLQILSQATKKKPQARRRPP